GLLAALDWLGEEYERAYGGIVSIDVVGEPEIPLSPEVEMAFFRIAQEALSNCGKHAGASQVHLSLAFDAEGLRLTVRDNGVGFDPHHVPHPTREGRLGLFGMRERATLLGGALRVDSAPEKGT